MATGVLCTNADVLKKAGAKASATAAAVGYTDVYIDMAEGQLCTAARYDWVTNVGSISAIGKDILKDAASSYAAIQVINYDMSGFSSRQEALMMINILWAGFQKVITLLEKDNNYKDFILTGAGDID
jgi:hypothetical protein